MDWNGTIGWVFGGFLKDFNPADVLSRSIELVNDHYSWDEGSLGRQTAKEVSINSIIGSLVILDHKGQGCCGEYFIIDVSSVVQVNDKGEVVLLAPHLNAARAVYLNGDTQPDLLAFPSEEAEHLLVYVSNSEMKLEQTQRLGGGEPGDEMEFEMVDNKPCSTTISFLNREFDQQMGELGDAKRVVRTFNCATNQFEQ